MHELLTTADMAEADRLTIAGGVPGIVLMERAGRAVADCVGKYPGRVLVLAGPGNNGGDGFVAARLLVEVGRNVRLALLGEAAALKGDAAAAAGRWTGPVEVAAAEVVRDCDVIVDALFGAGLSRPLDGSARAVVEAVSGAGVPVVAVDLPSGINGDTGRILGEAIKATETVTFFRKKPGHVLLPGRLHCGRLQTADIGIARSVLEAIKPRTTINRPDVWGPLPSPKIDGHKYDRGHVVVLSGEMTGAARLAARGALRAGAGLVSIASPKAYLERHAAESVAVMVVECNDQRMLGALLADTRRNSVVLGPGLGVGERTRASVMTALASPAAVVLDADALSSFAGRADELVTAIKARSAPVVLTPHDGEFARLFNALDKKYNLKSKLEKARAAADCTGAIVVAKGADTVVAALDGRATIADNAPATLATAGSGDVLAGIVAGLLAQLMAPFEAAAAAVWLHGEAARLFGPGLIAEDIPETLPAVFRALSGSAPAT